MKLIHQLIEEWACAFPSKAAIVDAQGAISYGELASYSAALAGRLTGLGIAAGTPVVVCVPYCKEILPCAVAVLKAGGIFIPVDDTYPPERFGYILRDSGAGAVLTLRSLWAQKQPDYPPEKVLFIDEPGEKCGEYTDCEGLTVDSPAMLMYTSGTTGNPKGVLHSHNMLLHLADFMKAHEGCAMTADARSGIMSSFSFMGSEIVLWAPMQKGGTACIAPEAAKKDLEALNAFLSKQRITHIFMPSGLAAIMAEDYDIRDIKVFAGGEKMRNFKALYPGNVLYNLYGSTEISGVVSKRIRGDEERILVGKPFSSTKAMIVDEQLRPVPGGETGEILFSSDYMSRQYWNLAALNAEKWVEIDGETWFRMGDRARMTEDGDLDILGRMDNMVKLRGFRIEIGEVETQIAGAIARLGMEGIGQIVVVVKNIHGTDHLACYYEARAEINQKAVADEISKYLTEYMIPDVWVRMEEFPRNANGKVMRKALPEPEVKAQAIGTLDSEVLARLVWTASEVLKTEDYISPDDCFIDLGGTSLTAMQFTARLREQGIKVSAAQVLKRDPLRRIAEEAEVAYEQLWPPQEFDTVRQDFARRGERIQKVLPVSVRQDEMLFEEIIHPDLDVFRNVLFLQMDSPVSQTHLREALDLISEEYEQLRSAIVFHHVTVVQQVITDRKIPLQMMEAESFDAGEMEKLRKQLLYMPLDLQRSSLLQAVAIHTDGMTYLCVMIHRIACERDYLRQCLARFMEVLEGRYPQDESIRGWREAFESTAIPQEKNHAVAASVKREAPPEICVYSKNEGPKLVFVHTGNTGSEAYYRLAARIGNSVSFAVIEPFNLYHMEEACYGIRNLAAKYIEILKRYQPEGPYLLGGWCYGGVVAHEMACQLEAAGETVKHLFLLDAHALGSERLRALSEPMYAQVNRHYFETCPLFQELRESGMLEAMIVNAAHVAQDMMNHVPSCFHGKVTYFKPAKVPEAASGANLRYWEGMMQYDAGNYEHYCNRDRLRVIITPHEHDLMMDDPSLDLIVPELYRALEISGK